VSWVSSQAIPPLVGYLRCSSCFICFPPSVFLLCCVVRVFIFPSFSLFVCCCGAVFIFPSPPPPLILQCLHFGRLLFNKAFSLVSTSFTSTRCFILDQHPFLQQGISYWINILSFNRVLYFGPTSFPSTRYYILDQHHLLQHRLLADRCDFL
jgi:hypothetical protein